MDDDKKEWINKLALKIRTFVIKKIGDLKQATFRLATGHMKEPPFSDEDLEKLREEWFQLLGGSDSLRVVTPYQPFYLFAVEATMKKMGDEDFAIISQNEGDNYVSGRRVGVEKPIPPAPLVFRPKRKEKKYDNSEFVPEAMNYSSAEGAKEQIQRQFEEEEKMGWMYPVSEAEARKRFGQTLRIASLAAIPKDEKAVRVLFDGTHSVQVNNEIKMEDQLEFPTPAELARVMEISREQDWGVMLAIAADIMKAHRRFLHDERDHGYLCCRADSDSKGHVRCCLCSTTLWQIGWSSFPDGHQDFEPATMVPTTFCRRLKVDRGRTLEIPRPLDFDCGLDHDGHTVQLEKISRWTGAGLCRVLDRLREV